MPKQKDHLCHLLLNLQDENQYLGADEEYSSAGTCMCQRCEGIHVFAGWDQCEGTKHTPSFSKNIVAKIVQQICLKGP